MNNYEKNLNESVIQNIVLENRKKLSLSGIRDVLSFDDQIIILDTELGVLTIKGRDLRINKLSIDTKEVKILGEVNSIIYSDKQEKTNESILGRLFKWFIIKYTTF